MASLVAALVGGGALSAGYWPGYTGCAVLMALAFALAEWLLWLARRLLGRLLGRELGGPVSLAVIAYAAADTLWRGSGDSWDWRVNVSAGVVTAVLGLFAVSWCQLLRRRRTPTVVLTALSSTAAAALLVLLLAGGGFPDDTIERYLALREDLPAPQAALEPSLGEGPYRVLTVDYGPGEALEAGTVDLTRYMTRGDDDLTDYYVDAYWDYELSDVPLRGRIWYPEGAEHCPVLFIAHGNHHIATESYLGYAYLGEYLASHGYVVVSVDHNACNMLSHENDGRAVLLLEHIRLLLDYSEGDGPLSGLLDRDSIAVAGHSRGGEMAATACLFNEYGRYPENGTKAFDYDFSIRSIIAIAPTVNQYKPAGHSVALENVNYLLLHGGSDRDVTDCGGMSQYENITFTGEGDYLKSALYIAGANHGQFNSLWGQRDRSGPGGILLNTASLLAEEDQQRIAQVFIKVFLDVTLRGDDSCRSLLTNWEDYAAQLPETVYAQCYESSDFMTIADFEEDSDLETVTLPGASAQASGFNWWTEMALDFAGKTAYDTHALRLRWSSRGTYTLELPALDLTGQCLRFDLCDLDEAAVGRGDLSLVEGTVLLTDADGHTARASIGDWRTVYPILSVKTDKLDYIFDTPTYQKAFSTVSIPAAGFVSEGETIDLTRICSVAWRFTGSGQVAMDNIGLAEK